MRYSAHTMSRSALEEAVPGMRRREFITLLGGAAAWPRVAWAQQARHVPVIGYVAPTNPLIPSRTTGAFLQRLRELGWIGGQTITIESRWAAGRPERLDEIAAEFVRLKVDLIVTTSTNDSIVMKQVASQIPMVFAVSGDPVGYGLVASLARPGGNVTGLSLQSIDSAGKRVQLMHEIVPGLHRLAILANPSSPNVTLEVMEVQAVARTFGFDVATSEIRRAADVYSNLTRALAPAEYPLRKPTVGMPACCARATSDHVAVVASPTMNSRRRIRYASARSIAYRGQSGMSGPEAKLSVFFAAREAAPGPTRPPRVSSGMSVSWGEADVEMMSRHCRS
jgi:ABC transporter substrate binding protein